AATIGEITGGGAHVSIDALGSPVLAANSVRCLRRRGRHVQVGLLPGGPVPLPMDLVIARELEIYGSHGMAARDYPAMRALVADGPRSISPATAGGPRPGPRTGMGPGMGRAIRAAPSGTPATAAARTRAGPRRSTTGPSTTRPAHIIAQ